MIVKNYIYIFLLLFYGTMHLVRVFDGVYRGTKFSEHGSLWASERFAIPMYMFGLALSHLIPQKDYKPAMDSIIQLSPVNPFIGLILISINFYFLRKYPVKWERNLCIALPMIIYFMMILGYFEIW